jgi:hypothetical protein
MNPIAQAGVRLEGELRFENRRISLSRAPA